MPADLRDSHLYRHRPSSDYQAKGYLGKRKTQQLHLTGAVILLPVIEDLLGHKVREGWKDFNTLDIQAGASGLQLLLQ